MTVASSPLAVRPKRRAVKTPVISPQNWMARLVEKVAIFALEKITRRPLGDNFLASFSSHWECFARSKQKLTLIRQTGTRQTRGAVIVVGVIGIAIRMGIVHHHAHEICAGGACLRGGILDYLPRRITALDHQDCGVRQACQNPSAGNVRQSRRIKYDEVVFLP